ncbi:phospholipase D-like domain-containing protein [Arthrobacter echini]|uniref:phospholipase D-like domain-containing protein n=1 Tax=Arthrobacter echini TaxID=1529066 RepID=UPI001CA37411|nr:phospholipase D-like domain-containing protein [Arthrobacter echini]
MTGLAVVLGAILLVLDLALRIGALITFPQGRRPTAAMAWLLAIFFIPVIGTIVFLLIGSPHLPRSRREKQATMSDTIRAVDPGALDLVTEAPDPPWIRPVVRLNRRLGAMPMLRGNTTTLITGYAAELAALTSAVESARHSVHLQTYILSLDETTTEFFDAVTRAVRRGVTVRVLLDHIGSWRSPNYRATIEKLTSAGIDRHLMLPVQPLRGRYQRPDLSNHRKAMIVDGERAFVGSLNIIDASYNKRANLRRGLQWTDVLVELGGPVVYGIEAAFPTDWYSETGDYTTPLPILRGSFDLLISLYAGPVWEHCRHYLSSQGSLLANTSHGDASLAALDPVLRLVATVHQRDGGYRLDTAGLDGYLIPRRPSAADPDTIRRQGRGIAYTRTAFAYVFEFAGARR